MTSPPWTAPTPDPVDGPLVGADRPMLEGYLNWQRSTLLAICAGLDGEALARRPIPSSSLSLLGIVRHLAKVERIWFRQRATRQAVEPLWDLALGRDHDFDGGVAAHAEDDVARLLQEQRLAALAASESDFDDTFDVNGEPWSLRMVHVHMVGEYARHNGHADLLREAIDGVRGR